MFKNIFPRVFGDLDKNPVRVNYVVVAKDKAGIYSPINFNVFQDAYTLYCSASEEDSTVGFGMEEEYPHISMYFDFNPIRQVWELYSIVPKEDIYVR